jgi:hypothetical protein
MAPRAPAPAGWVAGAREARRGRLILIKRADYLLPKPDQLGCRPGLMDEPATQRALPLTVNDRGIPLPAVLTGTRMARADDRLQARNGEGCGREAAQ